MKGCPACRTQYSDDTLSFCLQDGTPLVSGFDVETPTATLGEVETAAVRRDRVNVPVDPAAWQQSQVTNVATLRPPEKRSNTAVAVGATVVGMLFLFGVIGIAAWIFVKNSGPQFPQSANNTPNNTGGTNSNYNGFTTPSVTPPSTPVTATPPPTNSGGTTSPAPIDESRVRSEVSQKIINWKSLTESKDMNALRSSYAGTLDYYYTKRNVSASTVIADKQRAFREFSSIRINVSNINISTSPSGDSATAIYNKDWFFDGSKPWGGVIKSQMQLRKINGVWLITGEKDVPGTYKRTR